MVYLAADPRVGGGVYTLRLGEVDGVPVTQPLGLGYATAQHYGADLFKAQLLYAETSHDGLKVYETVRIQ